MSKEIVETADWGEYKLGLVLWRDGRAVPLVEASFTSGPGEELLDLLGAALSAIERKVEDPKFEDEAKGRLVRWLAREDFYTMTEA